MQKDTIKDIIKTARGLAQDFNRLPAHVIKCGFEDIANSLERLSCATPEAQPRKKVTVIKLPDAASLAYNADTPELPRLTAYVSRCGDNTQQECKIYINNDTLAELTIYRGKAFAVRMVRQALKGAMSRLGKHRRLTTNRRKREGK